MKKNKKNREPDLPLPRYIIAVFFFLVAGIITVGVIYYEHQIHAIKKDKEDELNAIAELKTGLLMTWRLERLADAEMIRGNPLLRTELIRWFKGDDSPGLHEDIQAWLESIKRSHRHNRVSVFSADRRRMLSWPEGNEPISPEIIRLISRPRPVCAPEFIDFHRIMKDGPIRLGILIPVPGCTSTKITLNLGYIYLEVDPTAYLFPLIQTWPTPSHTAETLLIRREGNDVVYLNELRHIKDTALKLRFHLAKKLDLPAARAVQGYEGAMEGYDYRGKAVLSALKKIPDSPWFLVAKVDQEEIYAPIRTDALIIMLVISLMIIGSGSFIGMWYQGRQTGIYRRQLEMEQERSILADRVSLLAKHANDVIFLLQSLKNYKFKDYLLSLLFGFLALSANLTLLPAFLIIISLLILDYVLNIKSYKKYSTIKLSFITILFGLAPVCYFTLYLLKLKKHGLLDVGSLNGLPACKIPAAMREYRGQPVGHTTAVEYAMHWDQAPPRAPRSPLPCKTRRLHRCGSRSFGRRVRASEILNAAR